MGQPGASVERPLRRVVGYTNGDGMGNMLDVLFEVLECGHRQRPRMDMAGPTNAARRRCRQCEQRQRTAR